MKNGREHAMAKQDNEFLPDSDSRPMIEAIASRQLILFAGGRISQTLGLPDFRVLIRHVAEDLGFADEAIDMLDYPIIAEAYQVKLRSWGHSGAGWIRSGIHVTSISATPRCTISS
jgi:hypothetical protein